MLTILKATLRLDYGFDACVWAMAAWAFWGMTCLGEATVESRKAFHPLSHATRRCVNRGHDNKGTPYAWIDLPEAKTCSQKQLETTGSGVSENNVDFIDLLTHAQLIPTVL